MSELKEAIPHWDLSNLFSGLEADDYKQAFTAFENEIGAMEAFWDEHGIRRLDSPPVADQAFADRVASVIDQFNALSKSASLLGAFIQCNLTTNSYDTAANRELSRFQMLNVRLSKLSVRSTAWIGSFGDTLEQLLALSPTLKTHEFFLRETVFDSQHMMSEEMEGLATELTMDGGQAFGRLQGTVTSQLKVPFEVDGEMKELPITVVRNYSQSPDPELRERAYHTEIKGWASIKATIAASINSVKGTAITLAKRRGWDSVLDTALHNNRIDRPTLDAMMEAIRDAFPAFRRYLKKKAQRLGKDVLPWWDLMAHVGESHTTYEWSAARDLIVDKFSTLTPELGEFAKNAFEKRWIDGEPRDGKRGGAFCMPIAGLDESRILANYDGSFEQISTLAHELGHGFHNYCQTGLEPLRRGSPSTLAETASIFCETLTAEAILKQAQGEEALSILETQLINATQVCVDISSRFIFESALFERRADSELSADDLCELMTDAQAQTYGDGVDKDTYHPYMWLWKPHYYSQGYNFYNFPYAFGHLFGLGLYAVFQQEGDAFVPRYKELLRSTGQDFAAPLAQRFGIDITTKDFWKGSLDIIAAQIDRYESL